MRALYRTAIQRLASLSASQGGDVLRVESTTRKQRHSTRNSIDKRGHPEGHRVARVADVSDRVGASRAISDRPRVISARGRSRRAPRRPLGLSTG